MTEAIKEDFYHAANNLKTNVNEQIAALAAKGETARIATLKRLDDEITSFLDRVNDYHPQTKTGKVLRNKLRDALGSLQHQYETEIKK